MRAPGTTFAVLAAMSIATTASVAAAQQGGIRTVEPSTSSQAGQVSDAQGVFSGGTGASGVHCVTGRSSAVHSLGRFDNHTIISVDFNTPIGGNIVAHLLFIQNSNSATTNEVFVLSDDNTGGSSDPSLAAELLARSDIVLVVSRVGGQTSSAVCYSFRTVITPASPF